ncbi:ice-binding family protein [Streptosporangium sp. NPDC002524]|uniref:ice-binding family protein n=1 Tax=Streptosporangium sp. NPDC002524 TaxID=3154537 RepID=UPI00331D1000
MTIAVALGCVAATPHAASAENTASTARTASTTNEPNPAAALSLGAAADFAVLAGTTVAGTGSTVVTGEVGVSPGSTTAGFPPGVVAGAVYLDDPVAEQAQDDLATAYNSAALRPGTASLKPQLGGTTVAPGVYNSTSGAFYISGELTLDGQGDPNARFVFRSPSLVTSPASTVRLANGAQACNVIWQVGGSATLGAGSRFAGSVLALTSITAASGTTVNGRLLARAGTVNLDSATVTRSACAGVPLRRTSTKLGAFCDPGSPGNLALVATVTSSGPVPPVGPVEFFANGVRQDQFQSDAAGHAKLIVSNIPPRTHEFVASFAGTNRLEPSTSPVLSVPVGPEGICPAPPASPATATGPGAGTGGKPAAGNPDGRKNTRTVITFPPNDRPFKARKRDRGRHHHARPGNHRRPR